MTARVIALSVCAVLLVGGAKPAEAQQEAAPSVRQYELDSIESIGKAMADGCTKNYPALKAGFDEAVITLKRRASPILAALLETEEFRHLATAEVPQQFIKNAAANQEALRSEAANVPEAQCKQAISDLDMSDEQLRALLSGILDVFDRCRLTSDCIGP